MQQPPEATVNLEDLSQILCAVAIRSGDFLSMDRIADMPPLQRVMHAVQIANAALSADPIVAKVLDAVNAAPILKNEFLNRRKLQ